MRVKFLIITFIKRLWMKWIGVGVEYDLVIKLLYNTPLRSWNDNEISNRKVE